MEIVANRSVTLFPNPAKNYLNIEISNANNRRITEVLIINTKGSTWMKKSIILGPGINTMGVDVSDLKFGIYFIVIKNGDEVIRERFSKQ